MRQLGNVQNASAQPASRFSKIVATLLPPLWCAGKLGNCPSSVTRFRSTCLHCRWRRFIYGKFRKPSYYIKYTYTSILKRRKDGIIYYSVYIDPRGKFTAIRCSAIIVLDRIMKRLHVRKPLVEICELVASYPTW